MQNTRIQLSGRLTAILDDEKIIFVALSEGSTKPHKLEMTYEEYEKLQKKAGKMIKSMLKMKKEQYRVF